MSGAVDVRAGLDLPHAADGPLDRLIAGHVKRHTGRAPEMDETPVAALFADSHFGLDRIGAFRAANAQAKDAVRGRCARAVLEEAYFIEKSGLAYGARMLLLAEDAPTRQSFALMAADEAAHLSWVTPYVPLEARTNAEHPFLKLIAELIEHAPAPVLVYVLQAILEGWGLAHYRDLAAAARAPKLAEIWRAILKDEAMHVRLGALLHDPRKFSNADRALTMDALAAFLTLVRCGPLGVAAALAELGAGPAAAHAELDGEAEAARKLALLRDLMGADGMGWAIAAAEEKGLFTPMKAREAVRLLG